MEDEEVILESSPLYQYMQEVGMPVGEEDSLSNVCKQTDVGDSWSEGYDITTEKNETVTNLTRRLVSMLIDSPFLMEEHHNYVHAYVENFYPHVLDAEGTQPWVEWLSKAVPVLAGVFSLMSWSTIISSKSSYTYLGGVVMTLATASCGKLIVDWIQGSRCHESVIGKLERLTNDMRSLTTLWKSLRQYHYETQLVSRGAVIVSGRGSRRNMTNPTHTLAVRRAAYLHLRQCMRQVTEDLQSMEQYSRRGLDFASAGCQFDTTAFEFSALQELHRSVEVLLSQWTMNMTLVVCECSSTDISSLVGTLKGVGSSETLRKIFQFHNQLLDGSLERKHNVKVQVPINGQNQANHSLYLHAREVLRLAKLLKDNTEYQDTLLQDIYQQLTDCCLCVDVLLKDQSGPVESTNTKWTAPTHTTDDRRLPPKPDDPVVDQIFVDTGIDQIMNTDSSYLDDSRASTQNYERCLMRELKGIIRKLAEERTEREAKAMENDEISPEQKARAIRELIEQRDIKALINMEGDTDDPEADVCHSQDGEAPSSSLHSECSKTEADSDSDEERCDVTSRMPMMGELAQLIASRRCDVNVTEETFGADSDCSLTDEDSAGTELAT